MNSKLVRITFNSQDRIKSGQDSTTDYRINLKDVFNSGQSGRKIKMSVNRARIPGSYYNVNNLTNTFTVYWQNITTVSGITSFTVLIPVGNYTSAQLVAVLNTQFDAVFGIGVIVWSLNRKSVV